MKRAFLGILFLAVSFAHAQSDPGFGIKAGLNYGGTGDISDSAENAYQDPSSDIGYHVGVFGRTGEKLFLRPELVYTKLNSTYEDDDFSMQKLDLPVLVGLEVIGPLQVFAGPAFQYILDTEYDGITLGDVKNYFTVGHNVGAAIALGKSGVDLRYERGFGDNEAEFLDSNGIITSGSRIDTRPDQLILSISLNL